MLSESQRGKWYSPVCRHPSWCEGFYRRTSVSLVIKGYCFQASASFQEHSSFGYPWKKCRKATKVLWWLMTIYLSKYRMHVFMSIWSLFILISTLQMKTEVPSSGIWYTHTHSQVESHTQTKSITILYLFLTWDAMRPVRAGHPLGRPKKPMFPWEFAENCPFPMAAFLGVSYLRVGSWPFCIKYSGQVWTKEKYKSGVCWNAGKSLTNWRVVIISPLGSFSEIRWPYLPLCLPVPSAGNFPCIHLSFHGPCSHVVGPSRAVPSQL